MYACPIRVYADEIKIDSRGWQKIDPTAKKAVISKEIGTDKIMVRLKMHPVDIGSPNSPPPKKRGSNCTYTYFPCSVVDDLEILVNDKPLNLPRSLFADLADLNGINFKKTKQGFAVELGGGQTAEAYYVDIIFNDKYLLQRKIFSAEFPEEFIQETTYNLKPSYEE